MIVFTEEFTTIFIPVDTLAKAGDFAKITFKTNNINPYYKTSVTLGYLVHPNNFRLATKEDLKITTYDAVKIICDENTIIYGMNDDFNFTKGIISSFYLENKDKYADWKIFSSK
jgi:hypothetical protein